MRTQHNDMPSAKHQRGVALVMAMVFLMILTIIGVTVMSSTALQEKMAGNVQDKNLAFQAAESALRLGEQYLAVTDTTALPAFTTAGTSAGHFLPAAGGTPPVWDAVNWTACGSAGGVVCVTGGDALAKVKTQPRYLIEQIGSVGGGPATGTSLVQPFTYGTSTPGGGQTMYRVTALGTGGTDTAVVMVQSVFRK